MVYMSSGIGLHFSTDVARSLEKWDWQLQPNKICNAWRVGEEEVEDLPRSSTSSTVTPLSLLPCSPLNRHPLSFSPWSSFAPFPIAAGHVNH
ncbi:hypothetical protein SLA2020_050590 [Shorea laevis]